MWASTMGLEAYRILGRGKNFTDLRGDDGTYPYGIFTIESRATGTQYASTMQGTRLIR